MCGISGTFYLGRPSEDLTRLIKDIVEDQTERGPDHSALESVDREGVHCVLGHNRLSIIDLSTDANQPMWDAERRYCVTFNGEIYNYLELRAELQETGIRFRTQSDTEVILEAFKTWGPNAVTRFNGMFAFAIYDAKNQEFWLFRDRFGVKPCYYHLTENRLVFASTPKVIARHFRCRPNLFYVARGLHYLVYEDSTSISQYEGIHSLCPGHYLKLSYEPRGSLVPSLVKYYDLRSRYQALQNELVGKDASYLVHKVDETFSRAVSFRLRSDVPIGLSLSGGLDSSLVAADALKKDTQLTGFTFGHPSQCESEGPVVQLLEKSLSMRVEYIWPNNLVLIDAFQKVLKQQDAPILNGSVLGQHLVYKQARSMGFKVLLGGQGADEGFMGYLKFRVFRMKQLWAQHKYGELFSFGATLLPLMFEQMPDLPHYWRQRKRFQKNQQLPSLLRLPPSPATNLLSNSREPLAERQLLDVMDYSLPTLLRHEDRNSMGNSIETRLPFMDYELLELALALPETLKLRGGYGKWVLRDICRGKIPETIRAARKKKGFTVPEQRWFSEGLGKIVRDSLNEHRQAAKELLRPGVDIDSAFSDDSLAANPRGIREASSLVWLAEKIH